MVLQMTDSFIRIETQDKKQIIDVFYTKTNSVEVRRFVIHEMVKLSIKVQSVDFNGEKLARCWLGLIISPSKKSMTKPKDEDSNWAQRRMEGK